MPGMLHTAAQIIECTHKESSKVQKYIFQNKEGAEKISKKTQNVVWVEITNIWAPEEKYLFQSRGPNPPPLNNKSIFLTYVTLPTLLTVRTECMSLERRPTIESTTTKGSNFYRIFQN